MDSAQVIQVGTGRGSDGHRYRLSVEKQDRISHLVELGSSGISRTEGVEHRPKGEMSGQGLFTDTTRLETTKNLQEGIPQIALLYNCSCVWLLGIICVLPDYCAAAGHQELEDPSLPATVHSQVVLPCAVKSPLGWITTLILSSKLPFKVPLTDPTVVCSMITFGPAKRTSKPVITVWVKVALASVGGDDACATPAAPASSRIKTPNQTFIIFDIILSP